MQKHTFGNKEKFDFLVFRFYNCHNSKTTGRRPLKVGFFVILAQFQIEYDPNKR